jgi:hypothetical protein
MAFNFPGVDLPMPLRAFGSVRAACGLPRKVGMHWQSGRPTAAPA